MYIYIFFFRAEQTATLTNTHVEWCKPAYLDFCRPLCVIVSSQTHLPPFLVYRLSCAI